MTDMWSFELKDGSTWTTTLPWSFVPYVDDFRKWLRGDYPTTHVLDWLSFPVDWIKEFLALPSIKYENKKRAMHPIAWVTRRVDAWLYGDDEEADDDESVNVYNRNHILAS
ncbi:MAG: hypothetical protein K9W43_03525 [Candidatus Thorarchaeota archaeon]|nr:hypothetical protein [Candidatus Thorarchaeota archaeon]